MTGFMPPPFAPHGLACAVFLVLGLSAAGILHVLWIKSPWSLYFNQPLDCGLTWRGRRVFGANKMLRGLMLMPLMSGASFSFLGAAILAYPGAPAVGLWPLSVTGYAALGLACGLGFMLGELPNSFFKRQLNVPAGGVPPQPWLRYVCSLLDRLDSTLGALVALSLLVPVSFSLWLWTLLLGPLLHAVFSAWLHGGRRRGDSDLSGLGHLGRSQLIVLTQARDRAVCGTKAVNLGKLISLGHCVPVGFVITDAHYREHLVRAGVSQSCDALLRDLVDADAADIEKRAQTIRAALESTPLAPELAHMLAAQIAAQSLVWPVIVRSSAAAEDTVHASFAGQLDSVPDVNSWDDLHQALRTVWLSPWSQRFLAYAKAKGGARGGMGVIVQQQVNASFSGVLFTRDPRGGAAANDALVEYVSGMGDKLVSGALTPARVLVAREDLSLVWESHQENPYAAAPSEAVLRQLAALSFRLEESLGGGQDIEWCLDQEGQLALLQARPITVGHRPVLHTWSNANIAENFPDPVTPLVFSIVSRGYTAYFRNLGLGFGLSRRRVEAMMPSLSHIVGLHGARLYYNLSNIHAVLHLAPAGRQLAAWFNQFTGAREFPSSPLPVLAWPQRWAEATRVAWCVVWQYLRVSSRVAAFEQCIDDFAKRTHPRGLHAHSRLQLSDHLKAFLDIRVHRWNNAALADAAAMVCYGLLQHVLKGAIDATGRPAQSNDLLKGLPGLVSTQPVEQLWQLSRQARENMALRDRMLHASPHELAPMLQEPIFREFREQWDAYLDQWGFRYSGELSLVVPTPQEDPLPLLRILRSYVAEETGGPQAASAQQAVHRVIATDKIAQSLTPWAGWRWSPLSRAGRFRIIVYLAQHAIRLRERARMKQALLYTRLRHVLLRTGDTFVASGWLNQRDDIFYLLPEEILDIAKQERMTEQLRAQLQNRHDVFSRQSQCHPPDSFTLPQGQPWHDGLAVARTPDALALDGMLRGESACGGQAEGQAAVVLDVAHADAVRAGQLLVTRQTDPGWATIFFLVKGLVIERGGMLSHGAIIAREYGIPAVIGVAHATQRIRNGQRIRVDGDQGVVEQLPD